MAVYTFINLPMSNNFPVKLLVCECVPREYIYESTSCYAENLPNQASLDGSYAIQIPLNNVPVLPHELGLYDLVENNMNPNMQYPLQPVSADATVLSSVIEPNTANNLPDALVSNLGYQNTYKPYSTSYKYQNRR
eukprot:TRINITY_DN9580_c0_g1_i1.p1 TRINITY_DN9580_c0_g1~~TRINITY_DN9580_c0_g1_i1.p1  ORF type:complete len:135 (+),score=4.38 TRINITY_DN9580_c0_g1_i1:114-518(+)